MSITNPNTKQQIKIYLTVSSVVLSIILLFLLLFGIFVVRPQELNDAVKQGQYVYLDLNNLQKVNDVIKADYIGKHLAEKKSYNDDIKKSTAPKIGIIITNLGLNKNLTEYAVTMPREISLGFSPYTYKLKPLLYKAIENGHEIYLYIPFEINKNSGSISSEQELKGNLTAEENVSRLNVILASQDKYIGVYSSYKEKLSDNKSLVNLVLEEIKNRGLIFVFGKHVEFSQTDDTRNVLTTNILIDEVIDRASIRNNLKKLEQNARQYGFALGYVQGSIITMDIINEWLLTLKSQGIQLVPISQLCNLEAKVKNSTR